MTIRHTGSNSEILMPCGGRLDTGRARSAGVLTEKEVAFCRENGIELVYDPVQIGWIPAGVEDDIDVPPYGTRAGWEKASRKPVARMPQINARDPQYQLRAWSDGDVPTFLALLNDPEVWTWLPETYPDPLTTETAAALIELSNASNHHQVRAVLRNSEIVGQVRLLYDVDPQDAGVAEISYWLGRAYWGKGIGSHVVRMFTARSFADNPGIRSIIARVHADNTGSLRILKKSGYSVEGRDPSDPTWIILRCRRA